MDDNNEPPVKPVFFNTKIFGAINDAITANVANIQQIYDMLVVLQEDLLALEKRVKEYEKNNSR